MRLLKDAQDALEREYLRGRQQFPGAAGGFDPDRAVEEEIYRLGLRLEGLKERLEPGGRRPPPLQSPPQPFPQPRCPPAPSPPPVTHSPTPESPALLEGPLGTAGDHEGVMGGLPWPLWHKQLRVEEDFGDLLERYKHFKSLPASLSLEQLSLAGSGSQEEVDAPAAGDGGSGKVPCRTRSLEEGADLETFPFQAIRELQEEVWQLRRRLEESLRRSRSYPEGKATPRVAPARRQPVGSAPSSPQDAAPAGYCSPAVPTSATAGVPLRLTTGHRRAQRPSRAQPGHRCLSLDLEELDELNWSLSRAVEAAQSVRVTTSRMSRALAAELGRARDLRGSCLF
ncbi:hypothetical protein BTVI_122423 [Pitangus sulphuratus]|nr:hypothetical protein BTVI_122423 [Pitangus sulphuratus]